MCFSTDRFYVTAYASHEIFEVALNGKRSASSATASAVWWMGRTEQRGCRSRTASSAIRGGGRLYINEYVGETSSSVPRRAIVRQIIL